MKLLCDDHNQVYVWVADNDESDHLSPHFDYEDDAHIWKERLSAEILKESGLIPDDWK